MKPISTICLMISLVALNAMGSGLYLMSKGDMRPCYIKYVIRTTESNTQLEITPRKVATLTQWYPEYRNSPWSVKCDGVEFEYTPYDNIRGGSEATGESLSGGCSNAAPAAMTLTKPGNHAVRIYNQGDNIFKLVFQTNYVIAISVNWESISSASKLPAWTAQSCPNLEYIYYANPTGSVNKLAGFTNLPKLKHLEFKNPDKYNKIDAYQLYSIQEVTNSFTFANVEEVGTYVFYNAGNVPYFGVPKAKKIGNQVMQKLAGGTGLHTLLVGDVLEEVGNLAFGGQNNLTTIEFATSAQDWIGAWNSHPILPNLFGTATASQVEGEATLTPLAEKPSIWASSSTYPTPTLLKLAR